MSVMPEVVRLLTTHHGTAPLPSSVVLFVRLGGAVAGVPPEETAFGRRSFFVVFNCAGDLARSRNR